MTAYYEPVPSCQIAGLAQIYESVFGLITDGFFVEIGAYDGKTYSNTYQLAELGWSGLYVEPVAHLYKACIENHVGHPCIVVENAFVSDKDQEIVEIYNLGSDMYTGNADFIHYVTKDKAQKFAICETVTLNTLLEKHAAYRGFKFDLLVIDVEGHELEVLKGIDLDIWRPTMIIIETHALSPDIALRMHADAIHATITAYNYRPIYADKINSIYCKE